MCICKKSIFVITCLVFTILLNNCEHKNEDLTQGAYIQNINDLITTNDGESYQGSISSFTTVDNEIGIKLKGSENKLFVLQQYEGSHSNLDLDIEKGQIIYLQEALIINSLDDDKKYLLSLTKESAKLLKGQVEERISVDEDFKGFGLSMRDIENFSKYKFTPDKSISYAITAANINSNDPKDIYATMAEDDCVAGGEGSSSCSVSGPSGGCSTTCDSGYYACCNTTPLDCDCVKEGAGDINPE